jgi:hypothetical protein
MSAASTNNKVRPLNTLHRFVSRLEKLEELRHVIFLRVDAEEIHLVLLAEVRKGFHPVCVVACNAIAEIAERGIYPNGPVGFLVEHRDNAEFGQACLTAVADVDNDKVMFTRHRFDVVEITLINEIRDHDDDTSTFDRVEREEDSLAQVGLQRPRL